MEGKLVHRQKAYRGEPSHLQRQYVGMRSTSEKSPQRQNCAAAGSVKSYVSRSISDMNTVQYGKGAPCIASRGRYLPNLQSCSALVELFVESTSICPPTLHRHANRLAINEQAAILRSEGQSQSPRTFRNRLAACWWVDLEIRPMIPELSALSRRIVEDEHAKRILSRQARVQIVSRKPGF